MPGTQEFTPMSWRGTAAGGCYAVHGQQASESYVNVIVRDDAMLKLIPLHVPKVEVVV